MKNIIRLMQIILILLGVICFSACEKKNSNNTGRGKLELSLNLPDGTGQTKSVNLDSIGIVSYQLMISIEDMSGKPVLSDSLMPLYIFGTGFVSENVELKAGEYKLTKFMVINPSGMVVFASPLAGSPLAYLTNKPLPFSFNIYPDKVTKIIPEVLEIGNQDPGQFGYANFGLQIIKPLTFYAICILDNPLIMAPTQMTQAKLTIYTNNGWQYSFNLEATVNQIVIKGGSEVYYFALEKEGYIPQKMEFTSRRLRSATKEYPLVLKIPWDNTAWSENFEEYDEGTFPSAWIADGNATNHSDVRSDSVWSDPAWSSPEPRKGNFLNYIDSSIYYEGNKSLHLFGFIGGCWAAIAYHNLNATPPFELEFAVRNGNETLSGCNPDRAIIGLNEGTSWTNPSQRTFIRFDGDGKVYGGGGKELGLYNNNTWYLIRIRYERLSTPEIKLSYWVNNNYCGSETFVALNEENRLNNLEIQVLEGSAWYDDIKILK